MESVTVRKEKLLEILNKNRAAHRAQFEEALIGYADACKEILQQRLDQIKAGKKISMSFHMPEPCDMTKEYDKIIAMLDISIDDEIELTQQEAQCYVLNDWSWMHMVSSSNVRYTKAGIDAGAGWQDA